MGTYDPNDPIDRLALSGAWLLKETPSTLPGEMAEILAGLTRLPGKPEAEEKESTPVSEHTWTEDGVSFIVEDICGNACLGGERFTGGTITSNETVLAREVLRQSNEAVQLDTLAKERYHEIAQLESNNLHLTDRVNALTARIEEALDLLLFEVEGSDRVERAYRMLEKVMMDSTKGNPK